MSRQQTWQLIDVLKEATVYLKSKGIENPRLNAERLMGHVLGLPRLDLYLRFEQPLSPQERETYKILLRRRAGHEPLQYILGETEFMSLPLKVTPEVLIPRAETEIIVERIIEEAKEKNTIRILDIGTGSGNIAVSLAKYLPRAELVGVDIHDRILTIARENAHTNGVSERVHFIRADIKEEGFGRSVEGPFDVVVFNPPYISRDEWETLPKEIRDHEPKSALCDDEDGLVFYRIIAKKSNEIIQSHGKFFLEIGADQRKEVETILKKSGFRDVSVLPDLNGIERVIMGTLDFKI